jgi:hypothetical protein
MGNNKPPRGDGGNGDNGCGPDLSGNVTRENRISCNYRTREATECPYCNVKIHSMKYHRTSSKTCEGSQAYCEFTAKQLECSGDPANVQGACQRKGGRVPAKLSFPLQPETLGVARTNEGDTSKAQEGTD